VSSEAASKITVISRNKERLLELLREAPRGKWVAFSTDETKIVAVADSFKVAVQKAKQNGEHAPVIWPIPERWLAWSL
jgi:hypothetical protein